MMKKLSFLASIIVLLLSMGASAAPSKPALPSDTQVSVDLIATPSPVVAEGKTYLVYEFALTNAGGVPMQLTDLKVNTNEKSKTASFHFSGDTLTKMMSTIGYYKTTTANNVINPGMRNMLYIMLEFPAPAAVPNTLSHQLTFLPIKNGEKPITISNFQVQVEQTPPVVIGPPLHGNNWIAGSGLSNDSDHRRAYRVQNGTIHFAQRFAIDFLQIGPTNQPHHDDRTVSKNFYSYNANIYAVADGQVVDVSDGMPENVPFSSKRAVQITGLNAGGNYVVIQIGYKRYAFYAHMIPGSIRVKIGDFVKRGQVIGHLGNSGSSDGPHLHFHVMDGPMPLGSNGVPYAFDKITTRPITSMNLETANIVINHDDKVMKTLYDQLVLENAIIDFPEQ